MGYENGVSCNASPSPPFPTVTQMVSRKTLEEFSYGCFDELYYTKANVPNKWQYVGKDTLENEKKRLVLTGTTMLINEYMGIGHLMYDVQLIQILHSINVTRIVMQRAPCIRNDFCQGMGTWNSFFKGYYMIALSAALQSQSHAIPIYLRFQQDMELKPIVLNAAKDDFVRYPYPIVRNSSSSKKYPDFILLDNDQICFEHVIRRIISCDGCFYGSLSEFAVTKFKQTTYEYLNKYYNRRKDKINHVFEGEIGHTSTAHEKIRTTHNNNQNVFGLPLAAGRIIITYAYRGITATRHANNVDMLRSALLAGFADASQYKVRFVDTSTGTLGFAEQMYIAATSHVIITDHGAFQTNLIYMRNASLLIDLRGDYPNGECVNFEHMACMFGIYFQHVVMSQLKVHGGMKGFNITTEEAAQVVQIIQNYSSEKPYIMAN